MLNVIIAIIIINHTQEIKQKKKKKVYFWNIAMMRMRHKCDHSELDLWPIAKI